MELAGYTFGDKIGQGGMARVYLGQQLSLARSVAIKVLDRQMGKHSAVREAFERESLIIARLSHPNIIHVIDKGVSDEGLPYFIMEYVDGTDLALMLSDATLTLNQKFELALQICKALSYAHQNGVIHRDIKPSNIIVDAHFNARVLDFGISQFNDSSADLEGDSRANQTEACERDVMGTLSYLAPELHSGAPATVASDIYSLGLLLFEMLVGHLPHEGKNRISECGIAVPASFDRLLLACIQPNPNDRPASVAIISEQILLALHGAHLSRKQLDNAAATMDKKTFSLLDVLGESTLGAVYLFVEKKSAKQLVVKKCHLKDGSASRVGLGYVGGKRLAAVAKTNAELARNSHLVRVHGASKNARAFVVVMDYLSGGSLQNRLLHAYSVHEFMRVAQPLAAGLAEAHKHNIVHGNLRASNVMFDANNGVKLTDFGMPSHIDAAEQQALSVTARDRHWYGLPDEGLTPAADIYACGIIFYQMLMADLPRIDKHGVLQVGRLFRSRPKALQQLLRQMLASNPAARIGSMNQVVTVLNEVSNNLDTACWVAPTKVAAGKAGGEKKKVLLLSLLVLLFTVLLNTGLITLFGRDHVLALFSQLWGG